jgi:zinc D-Ala-D-Ala dipeptidase
MIETAREAARLYQVPDKKASVKNILFVLCLWFGFIVAADSRADPIPPEAPSALRALIGEYRSADANLTVYESGGRLYVEGLGLHEMPLRRLNATQFAVDAPAAASPTHVDFALDAQRRPVSVAVGGTQLQFRDIGRETLLQIRAGVKTDTGGLRAAALAATPPTEAPPKRPFDLVDLSAVDPAIKLDIRYASANNFLGFPLYERSAAYLQRPAAEALGRVQRSLKDKGYGLLIHDGYRPWFVTKMFWDATPESAHMFVADPSQGSRHNRGCATDLSLYDLKTGAPVEMTGGYDEMSPRSYADYVGGTTRQRWLRNLLRSEMEAQGFAVYAEEWWHFDYKDWSDYAIGTATFSQLNAASAAAAR